MTTTAALPQLEGTEKQVNWAEDIRHEIITQAEAQYRQMIRQAEKAGFADDPQRSVLDAAVADIRSQSSAAWWIDNRWSAVLRNAFAARLRQEAS